MAFKIRKKEDFSYSSPQEMYQDNKLKKIMGPLDYQAGMLDLYMNNIDKRTVALELPTGSGKTLVGLLIGEYRRRKNKEKVLFLCPTNQLVHQVVEQANSKYGLRAIAFCGRQKDYLPKDKSDFLMAEAIGVTTYSSFFALHSFFEDVDILIMDDVHSCEDYIISNWTIQVDSDNDRVVFAEVAELLKPFLSETDYKYLLDNENIPEVMSWCNLLPMPVILDKLYELQTILQQGLDSGSSNYYTFARISENLQECNIYVANKKILIRPWIAPTMSFKPFADVKQRILMSATLGSSGELERITGIEEIYRLPIVNDWDKKGLGRRFFTFPDLSLKETDNVIIELQKLCKKSVFLVPDKQSVEDIKKFYVKNMDTVEIFEAKDIEESKRPFANASEATVILANRFDGIDFPDDESRLLFIRNLPKTTNLQEKFLITRMAASKLYAERIRTRIIQAVGRCSRNPSDYSIVCIMGATIQNDLTKQEKIKQFAPELRAEIQFGLENSDYKIVDEVIEQARDFLARNEVWQEAEDHIVDLRNGYWNEYSKVEKNINDKLQQSSKLELQFQYLLWKKDYKNAFDYACNIVGNLNAPALRGYKCFWNYMAGCMAYYLYRNGQTQYKTPGVKHFIEASNENISIRWLAGLPERLFSDKGRDIQEDDFFFDCIERIERFFTTKSTMQKLEKCIGEIISNLKSSDGKAFERGHKELGDLLGYISYNPESTGAPDPYWIINENTVIVSEDKIYEEKEKIKNVPISDVSEAGRHQTWIIEHEKGISKSADIYTVLITNSKGIDEEARIYAENIYYLNREDFVQWAVKALTIVRSIWNNFVDEGDTEWREAVHKEFVEAGITPKDYLDLACKTKLNSI